MKIFVRTRRGAGADDLNAIKPQQEKTFAPLSTSKVANHSGYCVDHIMKSINELNPDDRVLFFFFLPEKLAITKAKLFAFLAVYLHVYEVFTNNR